METEAIVVLINVLAWIVTATTLVFYLLQSRGKIGTRVGYVVYRVFAVTLIGLGAFILLMKDVLGIVNLKINYTIGSLIIIVIGVWVLRQTWSYRERR